MIRVVIAFAAIVAVVAQGSVVIVGRSQVQCSGVVVVARKHHILLTFDKVQIPLPLLAKRHLNFKNAPNPSFSCCAL